MHRIATSLVSVLVLMLTATESIYANDALQQLNNIRKAANLPLFSHSTTLTESAQNHADYIAHNVGKSYFGLDLHKQASTRPMFTGVDATERSAQTNYPSKDIKENISIGNKNLEKSMTGLMAAIYHRFTFLDFLSDTMGYGIASSRENIYNHVFNMGRNDMEYTCHKRPQIAEPIIPLDCLGTTVVPEYIGSLCGNIPAEAKFDEAFPYRCPNGRLLKADYMKKVCDNPPNDIIRNGNGRYYQICSPTVRVKTEWFNGICNSNTHPALHSGENRYYEICENNTRVYSSWFKNYCDSATPADQSLEDSYYLNLCHSDFKLRKTYRQKLDNTQYQKSPEAIIWPPYNAEDVSPVFYDEMPDPLPDVDVSGYPLSIQFNLGKVSAVEVKGFKLEKRASNGKWIDVKAIRPLNHSNDPHKSLSKYEFAWFPLNRLDWSAHYRASVQAKIDLQPSKTIRWQFKTKKTTTPLITVHSQQRQVNVPQNQWFTLYHIPSNNVTRPMKKISAEWRQPAKVESTIIDMNTLQIKIQNARCRPVTLSLSQRSDITLNTCY